MNPNSEVDNHEIDETHENKRGARNGSREQNREPQPGYFIAI